MAERWFLLLRYLCIWETLVLDGRTQPSNESISMLFILHVIFFFLTFSFPPRSRWRAWLSDRDNKIRTGIAVTDYGATRNPSLSILVLISHPDLAAKKAFIVSGYRQSYSESFIWKCRTCEAIAYPVLKKNAVLSIYYSKTVEQNVFVILLLCVSSKALFWLD